jgi:hypothetical protein
MSTTYDVLLLHNGADQAAVEAVAVRLRDEAGLRPFLDAWDPTPEESKLHALERAIEGSKTIAVLIGPQGMSAWREHELQLGIAFEARGRGKRVIPVLLPGASTQDVKGFLAMLKWADLDGLGGFDLLVAAITA